MIAWTTVMTALQNLVEAGTGLADGKVIWAQQEGARPAGAYATLRITDLRALGSDWIDVEDAEDPEEGEEIVLLGRGVREATLAIQAFGGAPGSTSPVARLEGVLAILSSPTRQDALYEAGVSVVSFGPIQSLDGVLGSSYEARAILEARLSLASEVEELTTYIETVEVTRVDEDDEPLEQFLIPPA